MENGKTSVLEPAKWEEPKEEVINIISQNEEETDGDKSKTPPPPTTTADTTPTITITMPPTIAAAMGLVPVSQPFVCSNPAAAKDTDKSPAAAMLIQKEDDGKKDEATGSSETA